MVVASLAIYKPNAPTKRGRGRPLKIVHDVDKTKVNEVIHDRKSTDGLRGQANSRKVEC